MQNQIQIVTFYEFKALADLDEIRLRLIGAMKKRSILGTIIIANEGFNSTVSGAPADIDSFIDETERVFDTKIDFKSSFFDESPFRKIHVKIKPEIVTLKKQVAFQDGVGTHVPPAEWNEIIKNEDVYLLDTRNDYEFQVGTFKNAINPKTERFSDLPEFVAENLDPAKHKKIAMFCTGGIRCEKFAPFMKQIGFENVYQLEGGILKYLELVPESESLWEGECYVFDKRVTVDENLRKGHARDLSVELKSEENQ